MKAIAIQTIPTNDRGGVVKLFTEDYGLRAYYVAWGKKAHTFQAMTLLAIEERERKSGAMRMLSEFRKEPVLTELPMHPAKAAVALFMAEVLNRTLAEEQANVPLFDHCWHAVQALDIDDRIAGYPILFLSRLIRYLGFAPPEAPAKNDLNYILDLVQGEWLTQPPMHDAFIEGDEAHSFSHALQMGIATLHTLPARRCDRQRLLDHLVRYLQIHLQTDRAFKSYEVLREVFA